jgi:hypothetical protein
MREPEEFVSGLPTSEGGDEGGSMISVPACSISSRFCSSIATLSLDTTLKIENKKKEKFKNV